MHSRLYDRGLCTFDVTENLAVLAWSLQCCPRIIQLILIRSVRFGGMIIDEVIITFCRWGKQHFLFGSFLIAFLCGHFNTCQTPRLSYIPSQISFVFGFYLLPRTSYPSFIVAHGNAALPLTSVGNLLLLDGGGRSDLFWLGSTRLLLRFRPLVIGEKSLVYGWHNFTRY
jgi:hypothetical protein